MKSNRDIYVSSSCFRTNYIYELLEEYGRAGINAIELSGGTRYYQGLSDHIVEYKKKYKLDLVCHSYFPPEKEDIAINLASCTDEIYEKSIMHYKNCIELLERWGVGVLSVHAGMFFDINPKELGGELHPSKFYNRKESISRFCSAYQEIKNECEKRGVFLFLENHCISKANYRLFGNTKQLMMVDYSDYKELSEMLDFKLLLDLAHLNVSSKSLGHDFDSECLSFLSHVSWIHISHNNGDVDEHKPLVEDSDVFRMYKKYFRDGNQPITLETYGSIESIKNSIEMVGGRI